MGRGSVRRPSGAGRSKAVAPGPIDAWIGVLRATKSGAAMCAADCGLEIRRGPNRGCEAGATPRGGAPAGGSPPGARDVRIAQGRRFGAGRPADSGSAKRGIAGTADRLERRPRPPRIDQMAANRKSARSRRDGASAKRSPPASRFRRRVLAPHQIGIACESDFKQIQIRFKSRFDRRPMGGDTCASETPRGACGRATRGARER
jgi:hypothetical protein